MDTSDDYTSNPKVTTQGTGTGATATIRATFDHDSGSGYASAPATIERRPGITVATDAEGRLVSGADPMGGCDADAVCIDDDGTPYVMLSGGYTLADLREIIAGTELFRDTDTCSKWIAGRPTEPGSYWIRTDNECIHLAEKESAGQVGFLIPGQEYPVDHDDVTHFIPLAMPEPPSAPARSPFLSRELFLKAASRLATISTPVGSARPFNPLGPDAWDAGTIELWLDDGWRVAAAAVAFDGEKFGGRVAIDCTGIGRSWSWTFPGGDPTLNGPLGKGSDIRINPYLIAASTLTFVAELPGPDHT